MTTSHNSTSAELSRTARKRQLLFVVSAPSGAGKTTLCNKVVRELPDLELSVSHTTRSPRPGEEHGRNYYFVSMEEFRERVDTGRIVEWAEIYGNCYGTARQTIEQAVARGLDLLFDLDEQGARQLSRALPGVVTILILPPSLDVLKKRLVERATDAPETVRARLKKARAEITGMSSWYDYIVVNDCIEEAGARLKSIIVAERCKPNRTGNEVPQTDAR